MAKRRETARGRKTRDKILKSAIRLICQHGYTGTSVDMICKDSDVVKTAVYWHFGSKAGLMAAIIDDISTNWLTFLHRPLEETELEAYLDRLLWVLKEVVTNQSHLLRLVEVVISEATHLDDAINQAARRLHDETVDAFVSDFRQLIGRDVPSLPMLAHTINSLMHGIHRYVLLFGDSIDIDPFFVDMKRTLMASLDERLVR